MSRPVDLAQLRASARDFAVKAHLADRSRELDEHPAFPWAEYRALGEKGWLGPRVPEDFGGAGWGYRAEATLLEELAANGGSVFAKLVLQPEFCSVLRHGSPAVVDRWYRPMLRGEVLVGNQITEPGAGSDVRALASRVERVRDGEGEHFVLTGVKSEAAFAADAKAALVYAQVPVPDGAPAITAFLVPQDLAGITVELHGDMGERWMRRGTVHYDSVRLPKEAQVGEVGKGFSYLVEELTQERAILAVIYLALARESHREVIEHARTRQLFGKRLGDLQAVGFALAEDSTLLDAATLYVEQTLDRLERGEDSASQAAMAKWLANTTALRVLDHAIQFHGGAGYSTKLPHEQRWRDVRSGGIAHGSHETLKMLKARELLGRK
jgi:cyclohexanecarboxyl-CoA dehydrogenase